MKKYFCILLLCVCLVLLLPACYYRVSDYTDSSSDLSASGSSAAGSASSSDPVESSQVKTWPCPAENSRSDIDGDYLFSSSGSRLRYTNLATGKGGFWCFQTGCTHDDESCKAYIRNLSSFYIYKGIFYCLCGSEDSTGERLVSYIPSTGEQNVIGEWKTGSSETYDSVSLDGIAYDNLYLTVSLEKYMESDDPNITSETLKEDLLVYNIPSGKLQQYDWSSLYDFAGSHYGRIWGFTPDGKMLIENWVLQRDMRDIEEEYDARETFFRAQNIYYYNYEDLNSHGEICLVDIATGQKKILANSDSGFQFRTPDLNMVYGNLFLYRVHDTLVLYDMETDQTTELVTLQNIRNYWLMDNKAFIITHPANEILRLWYLPLEGGDLVPMSNGNQTDVMDFSLFEESDSFFSNDSVWMSKDRFYTKYRA